ncbi:hypothetical protein PABG_01985 [Paracoccidioides brasiliensis Pb03]|nr:hypothetical protein PABG_01985 [Paracoccidioides brasiliensis Pb03]
MISDGDRVRSRALLPLASSPQRNSVRATGVDVPELRDILSQTDLALHNMENIVIVNSDKLEPSTTGLPGTWDSHPPPFFPSEDNPIPWMRMVDFDVDRMFRGFNNWGPAYLNQGQLPRSTIVIIVIAHHSVLLHHSSRYSKAFLSLQQKASHLTLILIDSIRRIACIPFPDSNLHRQDIDMDA